jgi:hypothetical protein
MAGPNGVGPQAGEAIPALEVVIGGNHAGLASPGVGDLSGRHRAEEVRGSESLDTLRPGTLASDMNSRTRIGRQQAALYIPHLRRDDAGGAVIALLLILDQVGVLQAGIGREERFRVEGLRGSTGGPQFTPSRLQRGPLLTPSTSTVPHSLPLHRPAHLAVLVASIGLRDSKGNRQERKRRVSEKWMASRFPPFRERGRAGHTLLIPVGRPVAALAILMQLRHSELLVPTVSLPQGMGSSEGTLLASRVMKG